MKNKQTFGELSKPNIMFWQPTTLVLLKIYEVHKRNRFVMIRNFLIVHLMIRKNYRCRNIVELVAEY